MITGKPKLKVVLATGGLAVGNPGGGPLTSCWLEAPFGLTGFNVADESSDGLLNAIVTLLIVSGTSRLLVKAKTPA